MDRLTVKSRVLPLLRIIFYALLMVALVVGILGATVLAAWGIKSLVTMGVGHEVGKLWMYTAVVQAIVVFGFIWSEMPSRER